MDPAPTTDFRQLLQQELLDRCRKNPSYSLRAFARMLGVHAPTLSHLLRGRRPLSKKQITRLGLALGLGPTELEPYLRTKDSARGRAGLSPLSSDAFNAIADWYPFAILELVALPHFKAEPAWIARVLDISVSEVNIAVERLVRLGLLKASSKKWRPTRMGNTTLTTSAGTEFTTAALRRVQRQFLEKALKALDEVPVEKRDQAGMTLNVALTDLPEIRSRIRKFRSELTAFVERKKEGDEVYQLVTSFFPLSKTKNEPQGAMK